MIRLGFGSGLGYSPGAKDPFFQFTSPRELENFHWYHDLGTYLGLPVRVDVEFRSGADFLYGILFDTPQNSQKRPKMVKITGREVSKGHYFVYKFA